MDDKESPPMLTEDEARERDERLARKVRDAARLALWPELVEALEAQAAHLVTTFPPYAQGESPMDKTRNALTRARELR
jgi:hypothetical protein